VSTKNWVDTMLIERARRRRRLHSEEFKNEVVRACSEPGVSVAGVALANDLNANLVRRWMTDRGVSAPSLRKPVTLAEPVASPEFVRVSVAAPEATAANIRIEVQREGSVVKVEWPLQAAGECSAWLRKWLR
jgi:transposase